MNRHEYVLVEICGLFKIQTSRMYGWNSKTHVLARVGCMISGCLWWWMYVEFWQARYVVSACLQWKHWALIFAEAQAHLIPYASWRKAVADTHMHASTRIRGFRAKWILVHIFKKACWWRAVQGIQSEGKCAFREGLKVERGTDIHSSLRAGYRDAC